MPAVSFFKEMDPRLLPLKPTTQFPAYTTPESSGESHKPVSLKASLPIEVTESGIRETTSLFFKVTHW